jgi:hypothetical protein
VGTQFDGFAHQTHEDSLYNCFKLGDIATSSGFTKLGIEKVGALVTRGVLIDVAGYKGVDMLGDNYEITVADLEGALKKENLALQPGDAVIRLGQAVEQGQCPLYEIEPRHRRTGGAMADRS